MTFLVLPFPRREEIYELSAAVDRLMGYPRDHVDGEPGFFRGANVVGPVHTETQCEILDGGPSRGVAVSITPEVTALSGQQADITPRSGGTKRVTVDLSPPGSSTVTDPDRELWERGSPRGGLSAAAQAMEAKRR